jgi:hypothetical protein
LWTACAAAGLDVGIIDTYFIVEVRPRNKLTAIVGQALHMERYKRAVAQIRGLDPLDKASITMHLYVSKIYDKTTIAGKGTIRLR